LRQFYLVTDPDHLPLPGDRVSLDRDESHHLFTVLRGGRDPELELVDGRGHRMTGLPCGREGKSALVEILSITTDPEELREPRLAVACAVVKGKRFEWALEKAVELGAHEFLPLETDHGVIDPRPGKLERWRSIMTAALKQSGRSWLPVLSEPVPVGEVLTRCSAGPVYFGAAPEDEDAIAGGAAFAADGSDRPGRRLVSRRTYGFFSGRGPALQHGATRPAHGNSRLDRVGHSSGYAGQMADGLTRFPGELAMSRS